ncbi:MAG: UDP-2,4-diacetamido-2,4,6-trideoxy-beta-L-altropyranose hydrolase [Saprospiraceae bacterium]
MKKKPKIFFRADGDSTIGLGHVIRSLALADMTNEHFESYFIIRNPSKSLKAQIQNVCHHLYYLDENLTMLDEAHFLIQNWLDNNSVVVLDGYSFETEYQKIIKSIGCKMICIDDINAYHFVSDIVINHAGGFKTQEYSTEAKTKLLLGPSYALLRPEFQKAAQNQKPKTNSESIFICLGGADPNNDILHVLQKCIIHKPNAFYNIVLGSAFLHQDILEEYINNVPANIQIIKNLNAQEMVVQMQHCAIAITSPSSVSYEYLCTGGKLFLQLIANNQNRIKDFLISNNLAFDFNDFEKVDQVFYNSKLQQSLFDGNQKKRFLKPLFEIMLTLEIASEKDIELYFEWANDPKTRSQSFHSEFISWVEHTEWYMKRIHSEEFIFYKAKVAEANLGQIRYDLKENEALINYSVDSQFRGFGIGSLLIEKTINLIGSYYKNDFSIIGFVKHENIASAKVFRKFGFEEFESNEFNNTYKYILKCKTKFK